VEKTRAEDPKGDVVSLTSETVEWAKAYYYEGLLYVTFSENMFAARKKTREDFQRKKKDRRREVAYRSPDTEE